MSKIQHPIRDQEFVVYQHVGGEDPKADRIFVAFFSDYQKYPMYFQAATYEEVVIRAVTFRNDAADKNEKHYRTRIEALRKARKAKKKNG